MNSNKATIQTNSRLSRPFAAKSASICVNLRPDDCDAEKASPQFPTCSTPMRVEQALLPATENGSDDVGIAFPMKYSSDEKGLFIGRVGNEIVAHGLESQWA